MKQRLALISVFFLGLIPPAQSAKTDAAYCSVLALAREVISQKRADEALALRLRAAYLQPRTREQTVRVEKKIDEDDPRGPRFVLRKLEGADWSSAFGYETLASQGDPRAFLAIAGRDVARFFGYELRGEEALVVPSVQRIQWSLDKLKEWGSKEEFELSFETAKGVDSTEVFINRFLEKGKLPMSETLEGSPEEHGAHVHDHSFHTPSIFLPNPVAVLARRQLRAFHAFHEYLKTADPVLASDPGVKRFFDKTYERFAVALDFGTGNTVAFIIYAAARKTGRGGQNEVVDAIERNAFDFGFKVLAFGGMPPRRVLKAAVLGRLKPSRETMYTAYDMVPQLHEKTKPVRKHLKDFLRKNENDETLKEGLEADFGWYMSALKRRINRIEALIRLKASKEPKP